MKIHFALFLCVLFFSLQGCQTSLPEKEALPIDQIQIYTLLTRGMHYAELEKQQRKIACNQLKKDYQMQADWQTAWLLVYAVNHDFSCININRTIELVHVIETDPDTSAPLQSMNNNHLNVLNHLQKLQTEKASVSNQLKKAQTELKQENSKIEELKAIETEINKKLDNVETQLEQENNKIKELKAIETDMNKKLDE